MYLAKHNWIIGFLGWDYTGAVPEEDFIWWIKWKAFTEIVFQADITEVSGAPPSLITISLVYEGQLPVAGLQHCCSCSSRFTLLLSTAQHSGDSPHFSLAQPGWLAFPLPVEASMTELDYLQYCARASPSEPHWHLACSNNIVYPCLWFKVHCSSAAHKSKHASEACSTFTSWFINISNVWFEMCDKEKATNEGEYLSNSRGSAIGIWLLWLCALIGEFTRHRDSYINKLFKKAALFTNFDFWIELASQ